MNSEKIKAENENTILSSVWLKAAVVGGLWASIEIIIGSFFHNLRIPFAGSILAANGTILMIAFYQMWPVKGLIWRAGLIAALMKSISPSAVILGPMVGILSEAFIIEFFIRFFGNNIVSLSIAGSLSVSSALIHKVFSLLLLYGFNIVKIYVNIFHFFTKQIKIEETSPWILVFIAAIVYILMGIISAFVGLIIGSKASNQEIRKNEFSLDQNINNNILIVNKDQQFSLLYFFFHIVIIPAGFLLLNYTELLYSAIPIIGYTVFCLLKYKRSLRRLKKPFFWIQLFILTFLAGIFWNGFNSGNSIFDLSGLVIGLEMNIRAIFVVIAFSSFGVELRNPIIKDYLFKKGFDKIYKALGLSFSALPVMIEAMPNPKYFLLHPFESFSNMMIHAREWLKVFEKA